jgi:hypothetical protein
MSRRIIDVFKNICWTHHKPSLGRWNIHNDRETILKIKYANEDNCGISGNHLNHTTKLQPKNVLHDTQYIYMMGYESIHN